ncbi:COQ9 family protein [Oceanibium sediminis]|uniref:COQ9 family protein n=1 Tax=Oceanibium sediminis TaxID=2026339 RepID=UPI000DD4DE9B|nr:COQ9 family protein [Oceanibium sediminis]
MTETQRETGPDPVEEVRARVVEAALPNVAFDGWSDRTLAEAVEDAGVDPGLARLAFPRGAIDLALAFHYLNDAALGDAMEAGDLNSLRYSDRVARAIELRLELIAPHREAVRRAVAMFALPHHAPDGARAIWHTADTIWTALGDTSDDVNWYTKRATLSGVYSASVLFWLGDESEDMSATRAFIARRIGDVMQIEKAKARLRENPLGRAFMAGPGRLFDKVRAPGPARDDMPGRWKP